MEEVDTSGFFVKFKGVELEYLVENVNYIGLLFEVLMFDECNKHADHGISIETT